MYGDTQLCWVNNGGKERDLELWLGTRKICGFKNVRYMELLEEILRISGNVILNKYGEPVNDCGETFDELERRHKDELDDRPDEDDVAEKDEKIERLNDAIDEAVEGLEKIKKQYKEVMTTEDEFGDSLESNLDHVANELSNAKED